MRTMARLRESFTAALIALSNGRKGPKCIVGARRNGLLEDRPGRFRTPARCPPRPDENPGRGLSGFFAHHAGHSPTCPNRVCGPLPPGAITPAASEPPHAALSILLGGLPDHAPGFLYQAR